VAFDKHFREEIDNRQECGILEGYLETKVPVVDEGTYASVVLEVVAVSTADEASVSHV
jgi:hypothetical protein